MRNDGHQPCKENIHETREARLFKSLHKVENYEKPFQLYHIRRWYIMFQEERIIYKAYIVKNNTRKKKL